MRRLLRILLNLATFASLLMGAAVLVLWPRSHWRLDERYGGGGPGTTFLYVVSVRGGLQVAGVRDVPDAFEFGGDFAGDGLYPEVPNVRHGPSVPPDPDWQLLANQFTYRDARTLGFRLVRGHAIWFAPFRDGEPSPRARLSPFWSLRIPYWSLALLCLPLPAARIIRWYRRRRTRKQGHCPACGYDLRATPARCPECGTTAGASATRAH